MGKKKIVTKADTEATTATEGAASSAPKTKVKKQVINGVAHINVSYNNTNISISDQQGNVVSWSSAGLLGFKGTKKSTPYAANLVAKDAVEKAKKFNLTNIKIVVKGIGPARESAVRGLAGTGLNVTSLMDETPVAHNGIKAKKPRRI
jgi:small subunit ribosomal protein S11